MTGPLWVDVEDVGFPALGGEIEADLLIVGGGLSGIGAAWAAARTGASVVLLEERTLGSGASGRNGGFVLAGPAMNFADAVETMGEGVALDIWRFTVDNNRLMARLVEEYQIDCGYLRRGSMSLAIDAEEMGLLNESFRRLRAAGISVALLAREDLPRPFDRMYAGGMYYVGNAEMNSGRFVRGMGSAIGETVRIFERSPVRVLENSVDGLTARSDAGTVRAARVVIATNAYTTRLLPQTPIAATRGQVVATGPLQRVIVPCPMYANYGYEYWRQTADGRLVVGGWRNMDLAEEVGTEERLHEHIQRKLEGFVAEVAGTEVGLEYRWAGIMGFTPDHFPLVGAVPGMNGVFLAAGYSGHGVSMAFTCGELAARTALGEALAMPPAFDPARFVSAGLA